jgi:hypothetical protein
MLGPVWTVDQIVLFVDEVSARIGSHQFLLKRSLRWSASAPGAGFGAGSTSAFGVGGRGRPEPSVHCSPEEGLEEAVRELKTRGLGICGNNRDLYL